MAPTGTTFVVFAALAMPCFFSSFLSAFALAFRTFLNFLSFCLCNFRAALALLFSCTFILRFHRFFLGSTIFLRPEHAQNKAHMTADMKGNDNITSCF